MTSEVRKHRQFTMPKKAALLGDSITYAPSSCTKLTAKKLGFDIVYNGSFGGAKIADMTPRASLAVASGADFAIIQIGTNDVLANRSTSEMYLDYVALFEECIKYGLNPICIQVPTINGTWKEKNFSCRLSCYKACLQYKIPLYDPWSQFANPDGAWSVDTWSGLAVDNVHPVTSVHVTASNTLVSMFESNHDSGYPLERASGGSLVSNGCFNSNNGFLGTDWVSVLSPSGSVSIENDGTNGHKLQVCTLVNPTSGHTAYVEQSITPASLSSNDKIELSGKMFISIPDRSDSVCEVRAYLMSSGDGISYENMGVIDGLNVSLLAGGESQFLYKLTRPTWAPYNKIQLGLKAVSNGTGTFTAKFGRIALVDLTKNGLP